MGEARMEETGKNGLFQMTFRDKILGFISIAVTSVGAIAFFLLFSRYIVFLYFTCAVFCVIAFLAMCVMVFLRPGRFIPAVAILFTGLSLIAFSATWLLPWAFSSKDARNYERNMRYATEKHFATKFFPDHIPHDVSDYRLDFRPDTFGRGSSSYIYVEYCCDKEAMAGYRESVRKMATISPMSLKKAQEAEMDATLKAQIAEVFGVEVSSVDLFHIKFAFPADIDEHSDALIYVMACDFDEDHPQTEAIFIDVDDGWVCFSRLF